MSDPRLTVFTWYSKGRFRDKHIITSTLTLTDHDARHTHTWETWPTIYTTINGTTTPKTKPATTAIQPTIVREEGVREQKDFIARRPTTRRSPPPREGKYVSAAKVSKKDSHHSPDTKACSSSSTITSTRSTRSTSIPVLHARSISHLELLVENRLLQTLHYFAKNGMAIILPIEPRLLTSSDSRSVAASVILWGRSDVLALLPETFLKIS
ncbi:hypothetical protein PROFUN_11251 [Planoprotostelium fungivorum]|uniref:Uncharacterized protein n=1 Tax=Planoprotostelium fungivorum TaxID=1890364 RepID=A0A2P6NA47_9EUKA|nr:hypothetical protein PROFUN_11251 [Planoprotostelium fungivorum]